MRRILTMATTFACMQISTAHADDVFMTFVYEGGSNSSRIYVEHGAATLGSFDLPIADGSGKLTYDLLDEVSFRPSVLVAIRGENLTTQGFRLDLMPCSKDCPVTVPIVEVGEISYKYDVVNATCRNEPDLPLSEMMRRYSFCKTAAIQLPDSSRDKKIAHTVQLGWSFYAHELLKKFRLRPGSWRSLSIFPPDLDAYKKSRTLMEKNRYAAESALRYAEINRNFVKYFLVYFHAANRAYDDGENDLAYAYADHFLLLYDDGIQNMSYERGKNEELTDLNILVAQAKALRINAGLASKRLIQKSVPVSRACTLTTAC